MQHAMISVVIPTYNASSLLDGCLHSIYASQECPELEVIVVDNASRDNTASLVEAGFTRVRLIRNDTNRGFSSATNQGIAAATGDAVLLLNSDITLEPRAVFLLYAALQGNPRIGAAAPRLLGSDGTPQHSISPLHSLREELFSPCRRSSRAKSRDILAAKENRVLAPGLYAAGAALMLRREALAAISGFDERFFLYYEDADLCSRLVQSGWAIMYVPAARAVHLGGGSIGNARVAAAVENLRSRIIYHRKRSGRTGALIIALLYACRHARRAILNGLLAAFSLGHVQNAGEKAAFHTTMCAWLLLGAPHRGSRAYDRVTGGWD